MMKVNDFLEKLNLAYEEPSHYQKGGWGKWNGKSWGWDCICLIKGILWGWNDDKSKPKGGGAVYGSNGVPDTTEIGLLNNCKDVSSDFTNLVPGEYLYMKGHAGTYIGNGYVIEATKNSKFKLDGVAKTQIGSKGERLYNGKQSGSWEKHGKLKWIDFNTVVTYTVKGDTLESISKETGVSVQEIKDVNSLESDRLYVGQELVIPEKRDHYIIVNAPAGVWTRLDGYGLDKPKFKVVPYNTKCVLIQKDIGTADGYNWDKIIYQNTECYIPNKWNLYE